LSTTNDLNNLYPETTHDGFFVKSMSDLRVAKEVLQHHLPADLLGAIDLEAIEICKDKFYDVHLKSKITDMLYRVPLKNFTQPAYIAALVEHQSTPQKHMPLRVLCYETLIMQQYWERYGIVPLVYTLVYYNGQQKWAYSRDLKDLIHAPPDLVNRYALKSFQLVELNRIPDQELRSSLWGGVMSLAMKHIYDRDVLPALRSFIGMLSDLEHHRGGSDFVSGLLYYLYERGEIRDEDQFQTLIAAELPPERGEKIMTLAKLHKQRGVQEGVQQGFQLIVQNMLRKKMDPILVAEITGIDIDLVKKIALIETCSEEI
jgi:recombination-promoting nuclease RpnB